MTRTKHILAMVLAAGLTVLTGCTRDQIEQLGVIEDAVNRSAEKSFAENRVYQVEKKTVPLYVMDLEENNTSTIDLCFMDSETDIPYITVDTFAGLMVGLFGTQPGSKYELYINKDGSKITLSRESHYPMVIDCAEDTIEFWDYDAFMVKSEGENLMDLIMHPGIDDEGEPGLFQKSDTSFERYGNAVTFRPGDYGIDLIFQDGEYYIPLQVVSDVVLSQYELCTLYNGEAAFVIDGTDVDSVANKYYIKDPPKERSEALARFSYNELCFVLDALYGLKEQHDINDFDTLFMEADLKNALLSTDPQEVGQGLVDLTYVFLDDQHSGFIRSSYLMKENPKLRLGPSIIKGIADGKRYSTAREKYYPDGPMGYEEVGNTAYITFDQFIMNDIDYYSEKAEDHQDDTIGLMIYAFSQITRKDSPIENVVLDLSNNVGGESAAAAFVIGTFLGNGSVSVTNTLSGAMVTQNFKVDANLDKSFDDNDSLHDYDLFCLTSPNSFSCGNLVPSVFKNSHRVTILGQTSGGGACNVQPLTTADGFVIQISGASRLAYTKNGSFYDIDQGVDPDFILASPDMFYDREFLTGFINDDILRRNQMSQK
ncbi:MAG: hypothetical protein J5367_04830 [Lachnospiraceae bacterium]|nr:hypothetical protein [Lachnospiraceae bacterium]